MGGPIRKVDYEAIESLTTNVKTYRDCNTFSGCALKEYGVNIPKVKEAIGGNDDSYIGASTLQRLMVEGVTNKTSGIRKIKTREEANKLADSDIPVIYSESFHTGIVQPKKTIKYGSENNKVPLYTTPQTTTEFGTRAQGTARPASLYAIEDADAFNKFSKVRVSKVINTNAATMQETLANARRESELGNGDNIMGEAQPMGSASETRIATRILRTR